MECSLANFSPCEEPSSWQCESDVDLERRRRI